LDFFRGLFAGLRSRKKLVDDRQEFLGLFVAGIVPQPWHRNDLGLRQSLPELLLSFCRNDRARSAQDIDDRRLDLPDVPPQIGL